MRISPLEAEFVRLALPLSEYRDSLTAARFVPEPDQFPSEDTPAWLFDGSWRAGLKVAGPDARKWLNGMITANVRDLAPGDWKPSFQLDPKGHILGTLDIVCLAPDDFILLTDQDQLAGLEARLRKFVFISKLTIESLAETHSSLLLRGAVEVNVAGDPIRLSRSVGGVPWLEIHAPADAIRALWVSLQGNAQPAGTELYERDRVVHRVPRFGADMGESELPQETGCLDHLDYTKGCYVGQEIVERIRARGAVHRHFTALRFPRPVSPGTPLTVEGKDVGRITSAVPRNGDGDWFALGYLRSPHDAPGTSVLAGEAAGTVEPGA